MEPDGAGWGGSLVLLLMLPRDPKCLFDLFLTRDPWSSWSVFSSRGLIVRRVSVKFGSRVAAPRFSRDVVNPAEPRASRGRVPL